MDKLILKKHIEEINNIIYEFLPEADDHNDELVQAVNYSVRVGGKRLRPMFVLETYRMFQANAEAEPEIVHALMAAIEFIHTYSLVHDDLPAMDNDEYRRGQLTTHTKYGEAAGILAGDALLNWAYEVMFSAISSCSNPEDMKIAAGAAQVLASKAGLHGMVGGQSVDVYADKHGEFKVDEKCLEYIYNNKTSALIEAAFMMGAILGHASDGEIAAIEKMAGYIGMAFQIQDDILDVVGDQAVLGKPIGSDEKNDKQTYVKIHGLDAARRAVKDYTAEALKIFDSLSKTNTFLRELIVDLIDREK